MKKQTLAVLTALVLFLGVAPSAWSVPMFARMYSYNCTMCHDPGYGQLNKFGFKFRAAGYRIPSDIGKDMNGGKYDFTNYITARFSAGANYTTKTNADGTAVNDTAAFTLGGASLYIGGGISKNFSCYTETSFGNGTGIFPGTAPSLSSAKLGYVTGSENDFLTVRIGKFSADGFAGGDRGPIGNPVITSAVKPTGTGLEVGYTHEDSRITLAFYNGIQNPTTTGLVDSKGKPVTSTSIQAPASDTNIAKDIQLWFNQFIGDDGLAINATYYNGYNATVNSTGIPTTASLGGTANAPGMEYYNAAIFLSSPIIKKLDIKAGAEMGAGNIGLFATTGTVTPSTGGFFGEVTYAMDDLTPIVFRYDYTTTINYLYTDQQVFTLGALTPFVEQVYMNPTVKLTMANAGLVNGSVGYNNTYAITDSLYVFF